MVKEPRFRIVKRDNIPSKEGFLGKLTCFLKSASIRLILFAFALIFYLFFVYFTRKTNPLTTLSLLFRGAFGTSFSTWATIKEMLILFAIALALIPAFKMRFWNIGAEGQVLMGGLVAIGIMKFGSMNPFFQQNPFLLTAVMILCSVLAGAAWGVIPAIFKAFFNTNETLFTLMLNYIAIQLTAFFSILWEAKEGTGTIDIINSVTSNFPKLGWIPGDNNYWIILFFVIGIAFFITIYMRYLKHGYEIKVVGESENTAKYAGINVKKVIIRTMILSGAICGFVGYLITAGISHTVNTGTAGGNGFTAIIVTWLGNFNVFYMALISFMLAFFSRGAGELASVVNLDASISSVLTGVILFFILASDFFIRYHVIIKDSKVTKRGSAFLFDFGVFFSLSILFISICGLNHCWYIGLIPTFVLAFVIFLLPVVIFKKNQTFGGKIFHYEGEPYKAKLRGLFKTFAFSIGFVIYAIVDSLFLIFNEKNKTIEDLIFCPKVQESVGEAE